MLRKNDSKPQNESPVLLSRAIEPAKAILSARALTLLSMKRNGALASDVVVRRRPSEAQSEFPLHGPKQTKIQRRHRNVAKCLRATR